MPRKKVFEWNKSLCAGVANPGYEPRPVGDPGPATPWSYNVGADLCCWGLFDSYQCKRQNLNNYPSGVFTDLTCKAWTPTYSRCDTRYTSPGGFIRPWDHPTYWSPNTGTTDPGCICGSGNSGGPWGCIPGLTGAPTGFTEIKTLDARCKDLFGNDYQYLDGGGSLMGFTGATIDAYNTAHPGQVALDKTSLSDVRKYYFWTSGGGVYPSSPAFPVSSAYPHWLFYPATWNGSACFQRQIRHDQNGGNILDIGARLRGCPTDLVEDTDVTGTTFVYGNAGIDGFGRNRTAINDTVPSSYSTTTGAITTSTVAHGACYEPVLTGCPPHSSLSGGVCVGDCVATACAAPFVRMGAYAAVPSGSQPGPFCIWEHDSAVQLPTNYIRYARDYMGRMLLASVTGLFIEPFGITRYNDAIPEARAGGIASIQGTSPTIHIRGSGSEVDIFYIHAGKVRYVYSNDGGRSLYPEISGAFDDNTMAGVQYTDAAGSLIRNAQVVSTIVTATAYTRIDTALLKPGRVLLFGYRAGAWYTRLCSQDPGTKVWSVSPEVQLLITDDASDMEAQTLGDGSISFICFNSAGVATEFRCKSIGDDGTGIWDSATVFDGYAREWFQFATFRETRHGAIHAMVLQAQTIGRANATLLGTAVLGNVDSYTVIFKRQDDGTYVATVPVNNGSTEHRLLGSQLRRRRDGKMEQRGAGGLQFRIARDYNPDTGTATWDNA